jgi:peroxiredoxin
VSERGPLGFSDDDPAGDPGAAPGPDIPPPARPRAAPTSWLIGVLAIAILAYIGLNTLRNVGGDAPGSRGIVAGAPLPPFAAPLALSSLDGDANVAREQDSGAAGKVPACSVRRPDVLNVCLLAERGPVVLAFLATRAARCTRQLDALEQVRGRYHGVQFAAVAVRGDRSGLRKLIRRRGWGFPVGYDRDGAVANIYAVSICPTMTFAYAGGIVRHTSFGLLDDGALAAQLRALVAGSKERGWTPPA